MAKTSHTSNLQMRIGHGFDVHRLIGGRTLIVGGVLLDEARGCDAHSDGDVVYHVVTDAILGALGQDDIGTLFPGWTELFARSGLRGFLAPSFGSGTWKLEVDHRLDHYGKTVGS